MTEVNSLKELLAPQARKSWAPPAASNETAEEEIQSVHYGRVGTRPQLMIMFQKCDGYVEAFPYMTLRSVTSHDKNRNLVLDFGDRKITIEGNRLERMLRYLLQNRVSEVIELDRDKALSEADTETVVYRIDIRNSRPSKAKPEDNR